MTDIALVQTGTGFDIALDGNDLLMDHGLETAVFLSLFTDRRAEPDQMAPDFEDDPRGYWGDVAPDVPGGQMGSHLWLLAREKQTGAVLARARQYAQEALAWMLEDKVAERVETSTRYLSRGVMLIEIDIFRPGQREASRYRYEYEWAAQAAKRVA